MLFYLKFIRHDVEKLHELIGYFFDKVELLDPLNMDVSVLFPSWYNTAPVFRMIKLETLLAEFIGFPQALKKAIIASFRSANDIEAFFEDERGEIPKAKDFVRYPWKTINVNNRIKNLTIADFLSELFVYLYTNQLGAKDSSFCKKVETNLSDYYLHFAKENANDFIQNLVCPYCGLEKMRDEVNIRKPDHDHLLPKGNDLFVFSSVNLKNLLPSGVDCNIKKDTAILLYEDIGITKRTKAFYPYKGPPHPFELYTISLRCDEIPNRKNDYKGAWTVIIEPNNPNDLMTKKKILTWDRVFDIKKRIAKVISDSNKALIDKEFKITRIDSQALLIEKLNQQVDRLPIDYLFLSTEIDLIPKRIFYKWAVTEHSYLADLLASNLKMDNAVDLSFSPVPKQLQ